MQAVEHLTHFTQRALADGHDPARIRAALLDAGWTGPEVDTALSGWRVSPDLPPVPVPRTYVSAREAAIYALLVVALAMVCFHVVSLGFAVIDAWVPDATETVWRGDSSMRFSVAALVAFLPVFLWLDRRMARRAVEAESRRHSPARRSFASLTVFVAALVLLGDVVAAVYALLTGDLSARFLAKVLLVAVTGALIVALYREDLDG
ncbi:DUF5671 domain-containing protein [Paracoccus sp. (in: a-proteobacteria)]|uniref:DUF5671 domain-containing protein n=1 Tax=Paracoccus sp. TaxID=267 RepID=UPI0026DEAC76|nr:DUF5671 domain-containing protein [Paracoccus sp. (in: a-proteobacteria)]MDO5648139.1 DUF5671 domain-containing protein [Paracoccus sp. (in: a-proteobacteria)]